MDRHGVKHPLNRGAAHLAGRDRRGGHPLDDLEGVGVVAAVFVDGPGARDYRRGASLGPQHRAPPPRIYTVCAMTEAAEQARNEEVRMEEIVALCKRRGFIFPSSEIYGGLGSTYDYGHY